LNYLGEFLVILQSAFFPSAISPSNFLNIFVRVIQVHPWKKGRNVNSIEYYFLEITP